MLTLGGGAEKEATALGLGAGALVGQVRGAWTPSELALGRGRAPVR